MFSCCKQQQSRGEYHHFLLQCLRILILTGSKNELLPFPWQLNKNENIFTIEIIEQACLAKSQEVGDFCMAILTAGSCSVSHDSMGFSLIFVVFSEFIRVCYCHPLTS